MKKPKPPSTVTLTIMTTITIVFWVFFSVYRAYMTKFPTDVPPEILKPISPSLDTKVLAQISEKVYFERGDVEGFLAQSESIILIPDTNRPNASPSSEFESVENPENSTLSIPNNSKATESGELGQ